ncbi:DUF1648 domain-containing protein [Saccharomonospora xinjiangensis]|uniref:DUF1648 domain-containing protein n=1 Tax=Saccharomonospora xinjiangensis TaxID=75294 RepID=UPI003510CE42
MRNLPIRVVVATLGVPALLAVVAFALRGALSDRLPDRVASHWGPSGAPDRAADLDGLTTWTLAATFVLAVVFTVAALMLLRAGRGAYPPLIGLASGLAVAPVAGLAASMLATLDTPTWQQASGPALPIMVLVGNSVVAGVVSWLIAPNVPPKRETAEAGTESVGLAPGERGTWVGGATNAGLAVLCVVIPPVVVAVIGALTGSVPTWSLYLVPLGAGLLAAVGISRVRVTIDAETVTIRMGLLGYPRRTVPIADITSAGTRSLTMLGYGGLGVRMNTSGDVAYKCRSGAALVLNLRSQRSVIATVDHPDEAAGLVNDLVRQAHHQAG